MLWLPLALCSAYSNRYLRCPEEAIDPEQLQLERLKIGWSQERVASELGVDVKTYARWERGVQAPTAATAWMLNQLFRKESEEIEERLFEEEERLLRERMLALPSEPKERGKLTRDFSGSLFRVNEQLLEPNEFYGREQERSELLAAVAQEGSISIVGPANIGKTWLLTYFSLVAPARLGGKVSVGYVDAALPANNTVRGFVKEALKALDEEPFTEWNVNLEFFGKYVHRLQEDRLVVLCIDNFDKLAQREGFDRSFFEALRAMGQRDMSFVTASEKRLVDIVSTSTQSSHFFNIFKQIKLAPFTRAEAREFVEDKGMRAGFSRKEQEYLLEYAQDRIGQ
ncbi:MAG: helix-turn-helix domain-containing protein [Chloroflexi bacterium]|nr:MAG: helix-turn-helix domain-containing protein [Chloroflexota bacterium]